MASARASVEARRTRRTAGAEDVAHVSKRLPRRILLVTRIALTAGALALAGCAAQKQEAEEAARNTYACLLDGERLVLRFDIGEVRMLMPGGDRVTLYQIPPSGGDGVRYSNGRMELRGKGTAFDLVRDGAATSLIGCQPFAPPA